MPQENNVMKGCWMTHLLPFDSDWLQNAATRLGVLASDVLEALVRQAQEEEKKTGKQFTSAHLTRMRVRNISATPDKIRKLQQAGVYATLDDQRKHALKPYLQMTGIIPQKSKEG